MGGLKQAQIRAEESPKWDDETQEAQERFEAARTLIAGDNLLKLAGESPDVYHALRDAIHQSEVELLGERDDYDPTDDYREDR